jgi:hypothetical protein
MQGLPGTGMPGIGMSGHRRKALAKCDEFRAYLCLTGSKPIALNR